MFKKSLLLFCLLSLSLFAQDNPSAQKYYCTADQIELTDSLILVHLEEGTFESDTIEADQGGIFIPEEALRCTYCRRPININHVCKRHG